jgi:hypothetical protein
MSTQINITSRGAEWGDITGALSTQTDLQTALDAKQDDLVSGTNIKTINSTSLLGSGDVAVQPTLVSGTNIKTINGNSVLGSGNLAISGGGGGNIGKQIGGGIVVAEWNDNGVVKTLVASLTNLSAGQQWTMGTQQSISIGATAQSFSDGFTNTNAIIAQTGAAATTLYAAGTARLFAGGGFTDWYLPSNFELNMCYNSATIVNKILGPTNGFINTTYWSSTENSANSAWTQAINNGNKFGTNKGTSFAVRAVRIHTI